MQKQTPLGGVPLSELQALFATVAGGTHLSEGPYVRRLEDAVEDVYQGYCVAMNSAGSCLFTIANWIKQKQESAWQSVVVPNNTFFATGAMFKEAGFELLYADCGGRDVPMGTCDFNMSIEALEQMDTVSASVRPVKAVVLTHVGGWLADDYPLIALWCKAHGIPLIEDGAHALGAKRFYTGCEEGAPVRAGHFGDAAVFSLYPTKAIPVGEGGLLVTCNQDLRDFAREFRNYGKYLTPSNGIAFRRGFNFRMDEWTAAVAGLQVGRMDTIIDQRNEDAFALSKVVGTLLPQWEGGNWYKYPVRSTFECARQTGKIYARTDQLDCAISHADPTTASSVLANSAWLARNHKCLPVGENMYNGMSTGEVEQWLGVP